MGYSYNKSHTVTFFKKIEQSDDIEEMLLYEERYPDKYQKYVKNTWKDWKLIPLTPPIFSQPHLKESYLDIPGMNGVIDLSFSFGPYQLYSNRTGSFEFYAINETGNESYWSKICREISSFLQRNEIYVILDDDKNYYYKGKFYLNDVKSDKISSKIVINYNVYPYKFSIISTKFIRDSTNGSWLWDPFDFENSIIQDIGFYKSFGFDNKTPIQLYASDKQNETDPHITIYLGEIPRYINIHAETVSNAAYLSGWYFIFKIKSKTGELIKEETVRASNNNDMEKDIVYHFPIFERSTSSEYLNTEDMEKLEIYSRCTYFTEGTEPYIKLIIDYRGGYI